jgi:hypothetical protein
MAHGTAACEVARCKVPGARCQVLCKCNKKDTAERSNGPRFRNKKKTEALTKDRSIVNVQ